MCLTIKILISNWPRTRKFSQLLQAGKTVAFDFSHHGHALVMLDFQFLCSDWSKFDRWVHAENLCSRLNLVYFDSRSWQSFVSTCDIFNCLLPLDVQNEIQLLLEVFCYSIGKILQSKLVERKKFSLIFFPGLINLRWSRAIMARKCDRRRLLYLGVHIRLSTRCKIWFTLGLFANYFSLKSLSLSLKSHINVL